MTTSQATEFIQAINQLFHLPVLSSQIVINTLCEAIQKLDYQLGLDAFSQLGVRELPSPPQNIHEAVNILKDFYATEKKKVDVASKQAENLIKLSQNNAITTKKTDIWEPSRDITLEENQNDKSFNARAFSVYVACRGERYCGTDITYAECKRQLVEYIQDRKVIDLREAGHIINNAKIV
jgi:hypothetical protein